MKNISSMIKDRFADYYQETPMSGVLNDNLANTVGIENEMNDKIQREFE